jgi:hypothetical protein
MIKAFILCGALVAGLAVPEVARAQCGYIPCAAYVYAPAIGSTVSRMGASPGWWRAGVQMLNRNPVRSPPNAIWRPYSAPAGYYRSRPAPPGVWYPRSRGW